MGKREWLGLAALFCLFGGLFSYLPIRGSDRYLSPDETAVAVSALEWTKKGSVSLSEPLAWKFPGLHPRSWITRFDAIVPVGFMGWPWINSLLIRITGPSWISFAAMLVILSAIYPFYRILRPLGTNAAELGTLIAFSTPALILYANRSLFPNAGLIALVIWSCWILSVMKKPWHVFIAGLLVSTTLAIRPVEIIWILPWFIYFGREWRPTRKQLLLFCLGILIAWLPLAWQAQVTYGSVFGIGYFIRGNPDPYAVAVVSSAPQNPAFLPFGLSLRNIIWNSYHFLLGPLFPWMVPLLVAFVVTYVIPAKAGIQSKKHVPLLVIWSCLFLILYYGNGRYADNIQGIPTVGNSFIRYLLPLGVLSGGVFAWLYTIIQSRRNGRIIIGLMALILVFAGVFQAYAADSEGLLNVQPEIARYDRINEKAKEFFKPEDVIISDRSDKIFFPDFRAWSPSPDMETIARLGRDSSKIGIGLFTRSLSQSQRDEWRKAGLEPVELYADSREVLYRLQPIK
ncbi:hypothetical protein IT407_00835 [Candidatus Uhrbacteria bacterium]|nr:hypothetical protein [Candidatus Uhrbacteria bacterium]